MTLVPGSLNWLMGPFRPPAERQQVEQRLSKYPPEALAILQADQVSLSDRDFSTKGSTLGLYSPNQREMSLRQGQLAGPQRPLGLMVASGLAYAGALACGGPVLGLAGVVLSTLGMTAGVLGLASERQDVLEHEAAHALDYALARLPQFRDLPLDPRLKDEELESEPPFSARCPEVVSCYLAAMDRQSSARPVSNYARTNIKEYFAESVMAYVAQPGTRPDQTQLRKRDPKMAAQLDHLFQEVIPEVAPSLEMIGSPGGGGLPPPNPQGWSGFGPDGKEVLVEPQGRGLKVSSVDLNLSSAEVALMGTRLEQFQALGSDSQGSLRFGQSSQVMSQREFGQLRHQKGSPSREAGLSSKDFRRKELKQQTIQDCGLGHLSWKELHSAEKVQEVAEALYVHQAPLGFNGMSNWTIPVLEAVKARKRGELEAKGGPPGTLELRLAQWFAQQNNELLLFRVCQSEQQAAQGVGLWTPDPGRALQASVAAPSEQGPLPVFCLRVGAEEANRLLQWDRLASKGQDRSDSFFRLSPGDFMVSRPPTLALDPKDSEQSWAYACAAQGPAWQERLTRDLLGFEN